MPLESSCSIGESAGNAELYVNKNYLSCFVKNFLHLQTEKFLYK